MTPSDIEARKVKLFVTGAIIGFGLAIAGALLGFHVSNFETLFLVAAGGFILAYWLG